MPSILASAIVLTTICCAAPRDSMCEGRPGAATVAYTIPMTDYDCRERALDAARWIRAHAIRGQAGVDWPADPKEPASVNSSLYGGSPGVILFLLQMYRETTDRSYLVDAESGADHLLAGLGDEKECGLYEGLAGIGFVLEETYRTGRQPRFRDGALKCCDLIRSKAVKTGNGMQWSETTDIISGSSGIGLFLLDMARKEKRTDLRELALAAGHRLIELARVEGGGLKWAMDSSFPRLMPNFSHGTAGVAYFLASLYKETHDKACLNATLKGAQYLISVADKEGYGCRVFHNEPDGKELYYLGWCHGPVGTARLFYRLYQVTGESKWMAWVERYAKSIANSGIPEKQTAGFWNNAGQCCGLAGVGEFFLSLHKITHKPDYLAFCQRINSQLLSRATKTSEGTSWIQAEHRVKPDLLVAQTGYMQGAAGIGSWFIRFASHQRGKEVELHFPDNPFAEDRTR